MLIKSIADRKLSRIMVTKRNFLWYSLACFGVPLAAFMVWLLWDFGGVPFAAFIASVSLLGGYCWGLIMWLLVVVPRVGNLQLELGSPKAEP